jgi:uncharacterized membrane protein YkoI
MKRLITPILLAASAMLATGLTASPVLAKRDDQGEVRKDMRAGNVRSLREIEGRVLPQMRGSQYLGPEYDATAMAYRLKFIRDGRVVWLDVDARTGQVLRRSN